MKIKTILIILEVGFLVLSGFGVVTAMPGPTLSSQKQLERKESENLEKLQFPVIVVHVREIYGTLDDPQYRPLANVKVKITIIPNWRAYWRGTTDENGTTEEIKVELGFLYKVIVSKYGYHTYECLPYKGVGIDERIKTYNVYFTMAKNGSPFAKQVSPSKQRSNNQGSQQSTTGSISQSIINIGPSTKTLINNGTLSGYVNDTSGNPIDAALIRVHFHGTYEEDYSDKNGYYYVTNIPICWCLKNATCSKDSYKTEWLLLAITENTTHDFVLTPNHPPGAPSITGPVSGKVGIEYIFRFNAVDPDNDDIKYEIQWGDGNEEVTDFYSSGIDVMVKHVWNKIGVYVIMARAIDEYGSCSDWGTPPLPITITKNKNKPINTLVQNLIQQHFTAGNHQSSSLQNSQDTMSIIQSAENIGKAIVTSDKIVDYMK